MRIVAALFVALACSLPALASPPSVSVSLEARGTEGLGHEQPLFGLATEVLGEHYRVYGSIGDGTKEEYGSGYRWSVSGSVRFGHATFAEVGTLWSGYQLDAFRKELVQPFIGGGYRWAHVLRYDRVVYGIWGHEVAVWGTFSGARNDDHVQAYTVRYRADSEEHIVTMITVEFVTFDQGAGRKTGIVVAPSIGWRFGKE